MEKIPFNVWLKSKLTAGLTGEIFAASCPQHETEGHTCLIMSRATVYSYLNTNPKVYRRPGTANLQKIAAKLNVDVSNILLEVSDLSV